MPKNKFARFSTALMSLATACASQIAFSNEGIVYDARALSMGGTATAIGTASQAQYYNPALLTFKANNENKTSGGRTYLPSYDGRLYFPTVVGQASDTVSSVLDALDEELDVKLSDAINNFNRQQIAPSAALAAKSTRDLRKLLDKIANKDLTISAFTGISGGNPGELEGSSFYFGTQVIAVGTSDVTKGDLALLEEYITALDALAGGASPLVVGIQHPNLVNNDGSLKDPIDSLTSSADVGALAIVEGGMTLTKEIDVKGQALSFGVTPKVMRIDAYRKITNFNNANISNINDGIDQLSDTKFTHITFNANLGVAAVLAKHYRVGLAITNAFSNDFVTTQALDPNTNLVRTDQVVKLYPRTKLGLGYVTETLSIGVDYDLKESTPMTHEKPNQDMSFGAEYYLSEGLALRLGYRQDQTGNHQNAVSTGLGFKMSRLVFDLAYSQSSDLKAGGLQLGWAF